MTKTKWLLIGFWESQAITRIGGGSTPEAALKGCSEECKTLVQQAFTEIVNAGELIVGKSKAISVACEAQEPSSQPTFPK